MNAFKMNGAIVMASMLFLSASMTASANELLITPAQSKAAESAIALDIVSDGNVSGFQFALDFGKAKIAKVNLDGCLSELPSSFSGNCRQVGSKIYVLAMANQMVALSPGVVPVGSIVVSATSNNAKVQGGGNGSFAITDLEFVDVKGKILKTESKISD